MKKILLIGSGLLAKQFKKSINQKWLFYIESSQIIREISTNKSALKYLHSITNHADPFIIINSMHCEFEKNDHTLTDTKLINFYVEDILNYSSYKNIPIINIFNTLSFNNFSFVDIKKTIDDIIKLYDNCRQCINLIGEYIYSKYDNQSLTKKIEFAISNRDEKIFLEKKKINMIELDELYSSMNEIIEKIYKKNIQFQNIDIDFMSYDLESGNCVDTEDLFYSIADNYESKTHNSCLTKLILQ